MLSEDLILSKLYIIRIFSRLGKVALVHPEIFIKLERIEKLGLKQFGKARKEEIKFENRPRIGFKPFKLSSDK